MQSLSLKLCKRLSNSNSLFRISSNLIPYTSSSPPNEPPISAASPLRNLLGGTALSGSDVRVGSLIGNRGHVYETLKQFQSREGMGKNTIKVPPHSVAGYATVATTGDDIKRTERNSGLRNEGPKTKREQLLKFTAAAPLLMIYPNAYSMLVANLFIFWHIHAGIEEILADYVHQEMTRNFIFIAFRLFLIIAMKDVFLKFVFV